MNFYFKPNAVHEEEWQDFARAAQESSLIKLDLSHNRFKMKNVCRIIQACQNSSVRHLDLSNNDIENKPIQDLIRALQNSPFTRIDLSDNSQLREFNKIKLIQAYPKISFYFDKNEAMESGRKKSYNFAF